MPYYLWRKYPTRPFSRFACEIESTKLGDGFRIVEHDPKVADVGFLHMVADNLRRPQRESVPDGDGGYDSVLLHPGDPNHFEAAIRAIPHTVIRPGRT